MVLFNNRKHRNKIKSDSTGPTSDATATDNQTQTSTSSGQARTLSSTEKQKATQLPEQEKEYNHTITASGRQGPPAGYNSWTDMIKDKGIPPKELNPADLDVQARIRSEQKSGFRRHGFAEALMRERASAPVSERVKQ